MAAERAALGVGAGLDDDLYFRVVVRGGAWTLAHCGAVADSLRGEARLVAQGWCGDYGWPKTNTFSIARYSRNGAEMLAKEFCRKSTFFFRLYLESDHPDVFEYPANVNDLYVESVEYQAELHAFGEGHPVMERALAIRDLAPRRRAA